MPFETLKRSHLKRNIILGVGVVLVISAVILQFTKAKYRVTESIPLVNGTINYTLPDLNIVGLYIDGVEASELDSSKTYTLDTANSTCTYKDGTEIPDLSISYDSDTGSLSIAPYTTKGTKCTLYFEEYKISAKDIILANYPTVLTRSDFSTTVTSTTTGTIYKSLDSSQYDDDGEVYYFAGAPTDNWVSFAGFYWRIIRINGDGTIRIIYAGTDQTVTTGTGTQISTSTFNSSYNDNMYVGYMYTSGGVHGLGTSSTIKGVLDTWYSNNLSSYADDIDTNAGFCNDRYPSTDRYSSNGSGGTSTTETYYAAYIRLIANKAPSFKCQTSSDLFTVSGSSKGNKALTYPIGLITADEVAYAGGVNGTTNKSYYLYTNQYYWTMSPFYFAGSYAYVFGVASNGDLNLWFVLNADGVRPVINLSTDISISGSGTSTDPYTVN